MTLDMKPYSQLTVDKTYDEMSIDQKSLYEMSIDKMSVYEMIIGKMSLDEKTYRQDVYK
jgi:hypothetical protein